MRWYRKRSKDNPPEPKEVYRQGMLYYTTSYSWIEPGSKESQIFKTGWIEWKEMNPAHPKVKKEMERIRKIQEEIRRNGEIHISEMMKIVFTI